jgi:hypothetical protein
MAPDPQTRLLSIKDAIIELETCRNSTLISYMTAQNALIGPEDAPMLVDSLEMVLPVGSRKIPKLDLFLHSPGGFLDPAYKIVRICREYSEEFNVIVPLAAKSAATVICLGANNIIMTSLSELGPIDPIIQHPYKPEVRVPARSIKDFFHFFSPTQTEDKFTVDPSFKAQMANLLDPYFIGSYQTALESSKQIANILLSENALKDNPEKRKDTVYKLTEYYYSHGFVIDRSAAREMGLKVTNAEENPELIKTVRQLFLIYQNFMQANKIIKLVGNRDVNRNVQLIQQPTPAIPPSTPVNLIY